MLFASWFLVLVAALFDLECRMHTFEQQCLHACQLWLSGDITVCSAWFGLIEQLQQGDRGITGSVFNV